MAQAHFFMLNKLFSKEALFQPIGVTQRRTYGRAKLRILRNMEFHAIQPLGGREHTATLWQQREVANHNKIFYARAKRRED